MLADADADFFACGKLAADNPMDLNANWIAEADDSTSMFMSEAISSNCGDEKKRRERNKFGQYKFFFSSRSSLLSRKKERLQNADRKRTRKPDEKKERKQSKNKAK